MKLTQRLSLLWLLGTLSAVLFTSVGFIWSVHSLALQQQERRVNMMAEKAWFQMSQHQSDSRPWQQMPEWLQIATQMTSIKALEIYAEGKLIYQWGDIQNWHKLRRLDTTRPLKEGDLVFKAGYHSPWLAVPWTWQAVLALLFCLLLVALASWWSSRWVFRSFHRVDNLSYRARKLLDGELTFTQQQPERPKVISQAFDYLLSELKEARQERSRFDAYMRTNTFLDPVTGLGNRLYFDNQLETAVRHEQIGYVLILEFLSYDELCQCEACEECFECLKQIAQCLQQVFAELPEPCLSRRSDGDFAMLRVGAEFSEVEREIKSLLRLLQQLHLPGKADAHHSFHIGVASLHDRLEPYQVLAEADMALRAAQVQEINTWFMYQREGLPQASIKGSVRWRTLLEEALKKQAFVLASQPVVTAANKTVHHYEMLLRLRDEADQLIPAHVFLPMARKCGLSGRIDQLALLQVLKLMRYDGANLIRCSVNLSMDGLLEQSNDPWLTRTLELYQDVAGKLIIEVAEYSIYQHVDEVKTILSQIQAMGCMLAIDQVGQNVVSAHYIQELSVDIIKLHASIVRNIDERSENQLFIRSLLGVCETTQSKVFALAVEQQREWRTLKSLGVFGGQGHLFTETTEDTPAFLR